MLAQNNTRFLDAREGEARRVPAGRGHAISTSGRRRSPTSCSRCATRSTKVDAKLSDVDRDRATSHAALAEQLRSLTHAQLALAVRDRASSPRALRSPNIRGQWGELQLRRVLEAAGMLEGHHFEIKESAHGEDGRLTPDVIVKLPGGKNVVVDAKVALTAFLDAIECDDEAQRDGKLQGSRAPGEGPHRPSRQQGLLGALPADPRHRGDVRARRGAAERRAAARHGAARVQHDEGRDAGEPADADRAAARHRLRLAAGKDRAQRDGDQRARAGSSTTASPSWRSTSRTSARAWRRRSAPTTARWERWRPACSSRRGA